jgi:hypothetical protein
MAAMGPVEKCRHGRGRTGPARRRAWGRCRCLWVADLRIDGERLAWLVLATLAHNPHRWTAILGLGERCISQHRTIRNRYLATRAAG